MPTQVSSKLCTKCKLPNKKFYQDKRNKDGLFGQCTECFLKVQSKYRNSDEGKKVRGEYVRSDSGKAALRRGQRKYLSTPRGKSNNYLIIRRNMAKYPDRAKARRQLNNGLRSGKVIKASACQNCNATTRLEAHHNKGYAPEFWYDVQWLCNSCHREVES